MPISAEQVKKLREVTGVGVMEAKKALVEHQGDFEAAVIALRQTGVSKAVEKTDRVAAEGVIGSYVHTNKQVAAFLSLNCETDFVARTDDFQRLAKDIAMHIAALAPRYLSRDSIPNDLLDRDPSLLETVLLDQPFVKDESQTVGELIKSSIHRLGENIQITNFAYFAVKGPSSCTVNPKTQ
ncbi:elongation factor Ts [Candidatus Berkelbacteria bacterium]|nr:elongation factor Ts [Candidatus Berkelbacteria bacterium]